MSMIQVNAVSGKGLSGLSFENVAIPKAEAGEALVKMRTATLNYRDLIALNAKIPGLAKEPSYVPLSCGCGEVIAVGEGVTRVAVGDRVAPLFDQNWVSGGMDKMSGLHLGGSVDGVAREYAVFGEQGLSKIPDSISDLEAATLPCAALTAWDALFRKRPVKPGDTVLLQGTGGVSIAALQFAKAAGATVIITSSSEAKLARAKALGADYTINYKTTTDWAEAALEITQGRGVDLVVDVVGGSQIEQSAKAASAPGAIISAIGMLDGEFSWGKDPGVHVEQIAVGNRDQFEDMVRALQSNLIRPAIDKVFPLEELPAALALMQSGDFFSKIVIQFSTHSIKTTSQ